MSLPLMNQKLNRYPPRLVSQTPHPQRTQNLKPLTKQADTKAITCHPNRVHFRRHTFACSSTMPCQTAPSLIGSVACSATFTPVGAPNAWPTMRQLTSKRDFMINRKALIGIPPSTMLALMLSVFTVSMGYSTATTEDCFRHTATRRDSGTTIILLRSALEMQAKTKRACGFLPPIYMN